MANEYKPLNISKTFSKPREVVWEAFTKPEQFSQWYAPEYFTIPVCEFDLKVGGDIRIDMAGPDGVTYPSTGVFKEISSPSRLVFTNSPLDNSGNKLFEVQHSINFDEDDTKTVINISSEVLWAGDNADQYLQGMEAGLNQAIDKLSNLLS